MTEYWEHLHSTYYFYVFWILSGLGRFIVLLYLQPKLINEYCHQVVKRDIKEMTGYSANIKTKTC